MSLGQYSLNLVNNDVLIAPTPTKSFSNLLNTEDEKELSNIMNSYYDYDNPVRKLANILMNKPQEFPIPRELGQVYTYN